MHTIVMLLLSIGLTAHATCFPPGHTMAKHHATADAISHKNFDKAIDLVYNYYAPIVKDKGFNLVFKRLWDDDTVNSDTDVEGSDWVINSYGGLARWPGMDTIAAYANVACHELGHHMGGAPIYTNGTWPGGGASVEGEADYWSSKECMKAIGFSDDDSQGAALALSKVLADLGGEEVPSPSKHDPSVVSQTFEEHPMAQCRLDTYLAGVSCPMRGDMSDEDPHVNSCYSYPTASTSDSGSRPRCWFAP